MAQDPVTAPPGAAPTSTLPALSGSVSADLTTIMLLSGAAFALAAWFDLSERLGDWALGHESWQVDELPLTLLVLLSGLIWFSWRRARQTQREVRARLQAQRQVLSLLTSNRDLARQLILAQENERRNLARELHDELGQNCSAIRADATYILRASASDAAGIAASAERIAATSEALYGIVKTMLRQLRPMTLDSLGLVAALHELCEQWEEHSGVSCAFFPFAVPDTVDDPTCITLFRLVQEGLTNVARHAQARQVRIALRRSEQLLILTIEDDGCGMAAASVAADLESSSGGFGLTGMRERVAGLQGQLQISSTAGQGVRIEARLPLTGATA